MRETLLALRLDEWVLPALLAWPLLGALTVLAWGRVPPTERESRIAGWRDVRALTIAVLLGELLLALGLWALFDPGVTGWQAAVDLPLAPRWGVHLSLGVDGMSLVLVTLGAWLMPLALLASWIGAAREGRAHHALLLVLAATTVGVLVALDLFLFLIFWALALLTTALAIGGRHGGRRLLALGAVPSLLMAGAIVVLWLSAGSRTFNVDALLAATRGSLSAAGQMYLYGALLLACAVRGALFPFHVWLPRAVHGAPPSAAAALCIEVGTYGVLRLALPFFPAATTHPTLRLALVALAVAGIAFGTVTAIAQTDPRRLVAYASVSQLGLVLLGILALDVSSVQGALMLLVNRVVSLGAATLLATAILPRRGVVEAGALRGVVRASPLLAASLAVAALGAVGVPGTPGFVGARLLLVGAYRAYPDAAVVAALALLLAVVHLVRALHRVLRGAVPRPEGAAPTDLDRRERVVMAAFAIAIVWLGVAPGPLLRRTEGATRRIVEQVMRGAQSAAADADGRPAGIATPAPHASLRPAAAAVSVLER